MVLWSQHYVDSTRFGPGAGRDGLLSVAFGSILLGFSAIFVKWGLSGGASPLVIGLYRMLFALPGSVLLVWREGGGLGDCKGVIWALFAGVAFAGDLQFWHESMRYTSTANATFIVCGLSPVWVAMFSSLFSRVRYRWLGRIGQLLGISGALVLAGARGARVGNGRGEVIAAVASFCYAAFSLALARSRKSNSARQSLLWMSIGSLLTFVSIEVWQNQPLLAFDTSTWLGLIGLGVVVQLLAWLMINRGIAHIPIALSALALSLQQLATPLLAASILHEPLRLLGLLGGLLIVVGIYCVATGIETRDKGAPPLSSPVQVAEKCDAIE